MITLHETAISGNCYKVRLLLAQLGIPLRRVEFDIDALKAGRTHSDSFLAMNPEGRVPVAELEDGRFLPADKLERAHVLRWLFWEQYSHEPYVAVVRSWRTYFGIPAGREAELPMREARGHAALDVLERTLARQPFLVGGRYTIADIAIYAYTHVAHEGGFAMARYTAVAGWLARVAAQPGHVTITARARPQGTLLSTPPASRHDPFDPVDTAVGLPRPDLLPRARPPSIQTGPQLADLAEISRRKVARGGSWSMLRARMGSVALSARAHSPAKGTRP